jgi:hypothetical protein
LDDAVAKSLTKLLRPTSFHLRVLLYPRHQETVQCSPHARSLSACSVAPRLIGPRWRETVVSEVQPTPQQVILIDKASSPSTAEVGWDLAKSHCMPRLICNTHSSGSCPSARPLASHAFRMASLSSSLYHLSGYPFFW